MRSAFDLSQVQPSSIEAAVKDTGAHGGSVQFDTLPELIGGIELSAGGQKVAWSIVDYLATLEKSAGEMLPSKPNPNGTAKSKCQSGSQARPQGRSPAPA